MEEFEKIEHIYVQNLFSRGGQKQETLGLYQLLSDLSINNNKEQDLIHLAAKYADVESLSYLIESGVKHRTDESGNTALHMLATSPLFNNLEKLDERAESIYKTVSLLVDYKVIPKKKNDAGVIAYMQAGEKCIYPFIQALADKDIKMDAIAKEGKNLMHLICSQLSHRKSVVGHVEYAYKTLEALLTTGLDVEDKDIFDTTALTYAQRSGVAEIANLLAGLDKADKTGGMTFKEAVLGKKIEAVNALIEQEADINEIFETNRSALMLACEYPCLEIVKLLLEAKVDVNLKDGETENTAVYYLLNSGIKNLNSGVIGGQEPNILLKILRELCDHGLEVDDTINKKGDTALAYLCQQGYLAGLNGRMAEEIIGAGCDINKANLEGKTPLMIFAESGDENEHNIAELLLDNDASTLAVDKYGNTALMYAAGNTKQMSAKKIVELILDSSTETIEKTNNNGETALDIAVKVNNETVVKLLLSNM